MAKQGAALSDALAQAPTADRARICEVWTTNTDRLRRPHLNLLSDGERAKAERYRHREDRERSVLSAALLRLVAARWLTRADTPDDDASRAIRVARMCGECGGPHGKPSVGGGLHISVSHAGAAVVVAITRLAPVGVDVEPASRAAEAVAALRAARTSSASGLDGYGVDALRTWTRAEAAAKATGTGLVRPTGDGAAPPTCTFVDLDRPAGYVGALAVLARQPFCTVLRDGDEILAHAGSASIGRGWSS
jgi:4'-phosphopantetheinyl transferase